MTIKTTELIRTSQSWDGGQEITIQHPELGA